MMWIEKIANEIIEKYPNKDIYTCQCGISTTGLAHFGNYRELIITYAVAKALEKMGKKSRCILSFDDFDRYKKVASDTPSEYSKYIGQPNYCIPSPIDFNLGYAEYYESLIMKNLQDLGVEMEAIYQHENYLSGRYFDIMQLALNERKRIFDIENKYKTDPLKDSTSYYPIRIYCENCGKDFTGIDAYEKENTEISYHCQCGYHGKSPLIKLKAKCIFKLDWAMRWKKEDVIFEPAGKGHDGPMGSYTVSSDISKSLLKREPPITCIYDFVTVIGKNGRMSKTVGDIITMEEALNLYGRDMVIWILGYTNPNTKIQISTNEGVERLYAKYEKFLKSNHKDDVYFRNLFGLRESPQLPTFRLLKSELLIWGKSDSELLKKLQVPINEQALEKVKRTRYYCQKKLTDQCYRIEGLHKEYLSLDDKELIECFFEIIDKNNSFEQIKLKFLPEEYKQLSKALNLLLFGKEVGPSVRRIFDAYLLESIRKKYNEEL